MGMQTASKPVKIQATAPLQATERARSSQLFARWRLRLQAHKVMSDDNDDPIRWQSGLALYRRFWPYLRRDRRLSLAIGALIALTIPSAVLSPLLVRRVFDHVLPEGDLPQLLLLGTAMIGMTLFSTVVGYLRSVLTVRLRTRLRHRVTLLLLSRLMVLPLSYFDDHRTGSLTSRVRDDVAALDPLLTDTVLRALVDLASAILFFGLLFWVDAGLAASGLALVAVVFGIALSVSRPLRRRGQLAREADEASSGALHELISGIRVTKTAAQEAHERRRVSRPIREALRQAAARDVFGSLSQSVFGVVNTVGVYVIVLVGAYRILTDASTIGSLFAFFMYLMRFVGFVGSLSSLVPQLQTAMASLQRVFELLDEKPEMGGDYAVANDWRPGGKVKFEGVGLVYPDGTRALDAVTLDIESGEVIALVGRSGAGKSTLLQLLPRLYDPTVGRIWLDGVDLRDWPLPSLRSAIGVVPQDVFLFDRTVRENLAFAVPGATETALRAAAEAANATDLIEQLEAGLDTVVGERGVRLSGGERQRLAIAREFLRDPPILILDEPTSNLDAKSEDLIRAAVHRLMAGRTCFVIAHRLSTIRHADRIVTLASGRIAEVGHHGELLAAGGIYADLYRRQFQQERKVPARE